MAGNHLSVMPKTTSRITAEPKAGMALTKSEAGMTLSDFIIFEKAEEAKRMLRYTEKPISDISSDLGFSSQSHLIRVFRKLEGITPKEYRNKFNM